MKSKYMVTGKSRLTGERRALTPPCSLDAAKRALTIARYFESRESAYERLKVERWADAIQQEIDFDNNNDKDNGNNEREKQ